MNFRKKYRNRKPSPLFVISLVNVTFLLAVFFLITLGSPFNMDKAVVAGDSGSLHDPAVNILVLKGKIIIDGKPGVPQNLSSLPRERNIIIAASHDIPYLRITEVLDILRSSGHSRLSLITKPIHN